MVCSERAAKREIGKPRHEGRLIPPAKVQPFVKRGNNDAADAGGFCEADMRRMMCICL